MSLAQLQKAFGAHLRDPDGVTGPEGLDDRRVGVYRELIFNNVESLMANNFPVINAVLGRDCWLSLIREFLKDYRTDNPYFPRLGDEFIDFLANRDSKPEEPGFLLELAHYENIEFALFMADEKYPVNTSPAEITAASNLRLASTAVPLAYQYPVHRISAEWQPPKQPQVPTFLLVFQDANGDIRFFELQGLTYHLLIALQENETEKIKTVVKELADSVRTNGPDFALDEMTFLNSALTILKQFQGLSVLRDNRLIGG